MFTVKTNISSLISQNSLQKSQNELGKAIERLSSGLRINSAKDDAAGLAVANRMEVNIRANSQISRGMSDGVSLMQTAEGGLNEINQLLQRSRELTIQSLNGTLSDPDRAALHNEFVQIREEIDRIAAGTEIFGKYPLAQLRDNGFQPERLGNTAAVTEKFPINGGPPQSFTSGIIPVAYIPVGAKAIEINIHDNGVDDDIQIFTKSGKHLVGTTLQPLADRDAVWGGNGVSAGNINNLVFTTENGFSEDAVYDDSELLQGIKQDLDAPFSQALSDGTLLEYSGDGNHVTGNDLFEWVKISEAKEDLIFMVVGQGAFRAQISWGEMPELPMVELPPNPPPNGEPVEIVMSANYGEELNTLTIQPTPSDSKTLGIDETALDPYELAQMALADLDSALEKMNEYRGYYGAMLNRFESANQNIATTNINLSAAQSRIQDADYAIEVSNMTRAQILQQVGQSVLAQANQSPQGVLSLLL